MLYSKDMALYFITGVNGSGKTTVHNTLTQQGYVSFDVDNPAIGGAYNLTTHQFERIPQANQRTPAWFKSHEWRIHDAALNRLLKRKETIFLCGKAHNQHKFYEKLKIIFVLDVPKETMFKRLSSRKNNDFGKTETEIRLASAQYDTLSGLSKLKNVLLIDATNDPNTVVANILSYVDRSL